MGKTEELSTASLVEKADFGCSVPAVFSGFREGHLSNPFCTEDSARYSNRSGNKTLALI
jgi:hypothetical protein